MAFCFSDHGRCFSNLRGIDLARGKPEKGNEAYQPRREALYGKEKGGENLNKVIQVDERKMRGA
jgi:hypothetical protein